MFDVNDDAKSAFRRVEVLTGPGRRRRWSADEKARIVAETLVPGARVSEVARRWQICSQQVFGWRRTMRQDLPNVAGTTTTPSFVPIVSALRLSTRCLAHIPARCTSSTCPPLTQGRRMNAASSVAPSCDSTPRWPRA